MNEVAELRERIDLLEEENRQLKADLYGIANDIFIDRCKQCFGMSNTESRIFQILVDKGIRRETAIFAAIYGARPEGKQPEIQIIKVYFSKIRSKISAFEIEIRTMRGEGFSMSPSMSAKARSILGLVDQHV